MRLFFTFILLATVFRTYGQARSNEYLDLAVKYTETGKFEEAIKVCDKLLVNDTENTDAYYLRGVNRYLLKDYENAITDFDKTLELDPNYTDAYLKRAKAKKAVKNYMGALKDYNQAKNENFSQTLTSLAGDLIRSLFSAD